MLRTNLLIDDVKLLPPGRGFLLCEFGADSPQEVDRMMSELIDRYGYRTPMCGHFGQECVHLRIPFDFKTTEGVAKYRKFIEEAADLVLKYGGSFSGRTR
jgi:FAD/FMN-containing dehydrogenase